ncbi:DUF4846 domain-containing protein [Chitinophaga rhizophila]|uniref:DUF4846 domain-containing protein n=1 Tax=Chitinophaga rhizophila TaxID=2866212 RepID=A0ABS7GA56_9BACT|nr:DUF4846 domain-containing protein [Chitinophaga rhizophila]MBW8684180.1 DUF4846 domain-containing protein [Chitinophaga rhizophila]
MRYFTWTTMVLFVTVASMLFWQYLEARSLQLHSVVHYKTVGHLPLPASYTRPAAAPGSFAAWLRARPLKENNTVYLYNGEKKPNQQAQFAVLDISVGKKDLQQCADAVIRLYAEYLYETRQYGKIAFHATDGTLMDYNSWMKGYRFVIKNGRLQKKLIGAACQGDACFSEYLQVVFSYAGTLSLSKELKTVDTPGAIQAGDVFIRGGSPGHAVLVMDVAVNAAGQKTFLLAQSYMPAQDIHILKNPSATQQPWYQYKGEKILNTPEWTFEWNQLMRFP